MPEGQYVRSGWVSMGEGRQLKPHGSCDQSPDGMHHDVAVENVQSVEKFRCKFCGREWYD